MRRLIWSICCLLLVGQGAWATRVSEYVGSGECEKATVTNETDNGFIQSSNVADDRVKVLIALKETFLDEVIFSNFKTPVVASLKRVGSSMLHTPTGLVCSRFKKPGIIGGPIWVDEHHCRFFSKDRVEKVPDQDGFDHKEVCIRDYFMYVK